MCKWGNLILVYNLNCKQKITMSKTLRVPKKTMLTRGTYRHEWVPMMTSPEGIPQQKGIPDVYISPFTTEQNMAASSSVYAIIGNIPAIYHSIDLRNYFSMFIEDGGFQCFHFRHRPEIQKLESQKELTRSCTCSDTDSASGGRNMGLTKNVGSSSSTASGVVDKFKTSQICSRTDMSNKTKGKTTCCVVKVKEARLKDLVRMYDRKHWLDGNGDSLPSVCRITGVSLTNSQSHGLSTSLEFHESQPCHWQLGKLALLCSINEIIEANVSAIVSSRPISGNHDFSQTGVSRYKTRKEQTAIPPDRETFTESDLQKLQELHPPEVMPNGNVGTPTALFLQFIKDCKLPPSVINKLGLRFPRKRTNKIYSNVHFDYGGGVDALPGEGEEEEVITSATGHELCGEGSIPETKSQSEKSKIDAPSSSLTQEMGKSGKERNIIKGEKRRRRRKSSSSDEEDKPISENDSDDCEDWERHEALHSDVAHHVERNKERLFEQEIELKWEKGGSGLVFYTDAQFWDAEKGDFDERTADDWDVDMSIYTDPTAGDKDARDFMLMRQEKRRRQGKEDTDMFTAGIGKFEKHTRGVGRRVMEKQGWKEGEGLGQSTVGISEALENEGQKPFDRKGFGYMGEKICRKGTGAAKRRRQPDDFIISTIYDNPAETDPAEPLYRSNDHHHLTYRHSFIQGETVGGREKIKDKRM